jgi:hypothetical protein
MYIYQELEKQSENIYITKKKVIKIVGNDDDVTNITTSYIWDDVTGWSSSTKEEKI